MKKLTRPLLKLVAAAAAVLGLATLVERRAIRKWSDGPTPPERVIRGTERFITTGDGARLRTVRIGEGPLVVLAHGIGGSLDLWAPIAQRVAAQGYSVLTYDQRGHNESTRGSAPFTPSQLGSDLLDVIASAGERVVTVAGHSLGGITIQGALEQGLQDHVDAIVLVSTIHKPVHTLPGPPSRRLLDAFLAGCRHPVHGLALMRGGFGRQAHRDDLEALRLTWTKIDPDAFADAAAGLVDWDFTEALRANMVPTRVLCGELDKVTPISMSADIAELSRATAFDRLEGVGHMLIWEATDTVVEHILASADAATR